MGSLQRFAGLLVALLLALSVGVACSAEEDGTGIEEDQGQVEETVAEEDGEEPAPPPTPQAPPPKVLKGSGAQVESLRLAADSPLVVTAEHRGSSNFIVELLGRGGGGQHFLFNEIGSYSGQAAVAEISRGRYRVKVDADGTWTIRFEQPVPTGRAERVPGSVRGSGAKVVRMRSDRDLQPIITGTHRGQSNFIVSLIGYGELTGEILVFNEIGNFKGETIADEMPAGDFLLYVQADGRWTLKFTP
jgi:hypothetical protein